MNVYVSDCPADRQLALKDVLQYSVNFVTGEERLPELERNTGITYRDLERIPAAA